MQTPHIFLIDDDKGLRGSMASWLRRDGAEVSEFDRAEEFLGEFQNDRSRPGCLISEFALPGISGLELQRRLATGPVRLPIIFIGRDVSTRTAVGAMRNGAADVLEKPLTADELLDCVRELLQQEAEACERFRHQAAVESQLSTLTPREREVFELLVLGHTTKQIASKLGINCKTVFVHRARVMQKMEADTLVELSLLAQQRCFGPTSITVQIHEHPFGQHTM